MIAGASTTRAPGRGTLVSQLLRDRRATAMLTALTLLAYVVPAVAPAIEDDRANTSQIWRLLTCHLAHFDSVHLFWSGSMLVALAALLEPLGRGRLLVCVLCSALAIPLAVLWWAPDVTTYRGLSGIDSALFAMALVGFLREAMAERRPGLVILFLATGIGFLAKLAFEMTTGGAVFADSPNFRPVPLAHAVGTFVGTICAVTMQPRAGRAGA